MAVYTKRFSTPFGYIEVLQNGIPVEFEITSEINGYDRVWIDDETVLFPDGLYEIIIPIEKTNPGDVFIVRYSSGELEYDGGDEHTLNALCEGEEYVYGFGWQDTHDWEECFNYMDSGLEQNRKRIIPYEYYGINGSGVEFHIVGGSEMYACLNDFYQKLGKEIRIIAAWSNRSSKFAWTIVSFVTC